MSEIQPIIHRGRVAALVVAGQLRRAMAEPGPHLIEAIVPALGQRPSRGVTEPGL